MGSQSDGTYQKMANLADTFVAPSEYLQNRFVSEFGISPKKIVYMDYGFDLSRFSGIRRIKEDAI